MTNTTGATRIAGRICRALISLSAPTAEAAAVEIAHAAATQRCPWWRSSEASFVATPLHAKPSPAPIIVIEGAGRRTMLTTYGVVASTASAMSTNVIVSSPL